MRQAQALLSLQRYEEAKVPLAKAKLLEPSSKQVRALSCAVVCMWVLLCARVRGSVASYGSMRSLT